MSVVVFKPRGPTKPILPTRHGFDPSQTRDDSGRWTDGGAGAGSNKAGDKAASAKKHWKDALGSHLDRRDIPGMPPAGVYLDSFSVESAQALALEVDDFYREFRFAPRPHNIFDVTSGGPGTWGEAREIRTEHGTIYALYFAGDGNLADMDKATAKLREIAGTRLPGMSEPLFDSMTNPAHVMRHELGHLLFYRLQDPSQMMDGAARDAWKKWHQAHRTELPAAVGAYAVRDEHEAFASLVAGTKYADRKNSKTDKLLKSFEDDVLSLARKP